jgi:hypothetical protein
MARTIDPSQSLGSCYALRGRLVASENAVEKREGSKYTGNDLKQRDFTHLSYVLAVFARFFSLRLYHRRVASCTASIRAQPGSQASRPLEAPLARPLYRPRFQRLACPMGGRLHFPMAVPHARPYEPPPGCSSASHHATPYPELPCLGPGIGCPPRRIASRGPGASFP